jgi:DHA2 family multidrug resistance protein
MFSGVFVVFLAALSGPRRILLRAAAAFTLASALLPFVSGYWAMLALTIVAGITSGTFYSLTMTFVLTALPKRLIIFGIAAYAADIVFVSNIASWLEGWYVDHLSSAAVDQYRNLAELSDGVPSANGEEEPELGFAKRA